MDKLVIVFVKHPELGKAKTRLAATLGQETALHVYKLLLKHTLSICKSLDATIQIHYTNEVIKNDMWDGYTKVAQHGKDLGERMFNAFDNNKKYKKKIIIGSDCFDLTANHITQAFALLDTEDTVLGPANDGGYYLFGMKEVSKKYFSSIEWSTNKVANQTIQQIKLLNKSHILLDTLVDIDTEDDLKTYKYYEQIISRNH